MVAWTGLRGGPPRWSRIRRRHAAPDAGLRNWAVSLPRKPLRGCREKRVSAKQASGVEHFTSAVGACHCSIAYALAGEACGEGQDDAEVGNVVAGGKDIKLGGS